MILETKIKDPLNLTMSHHGYTILGNDENSEDLPLTPGAIIGGEHYGFTLVVDREGKQFETTYPTQCRLSAIEIREEILFVYEDHKYLPWKFDKVGNLMNEAQFLKTWRPDLDYLHDQGIFSEERIDEVNSQAYRKTLK